MDSGCPASERGFTLVEMMVAVALGLLIAAGMAYLIAGMSASRNEVEKFNQQIESGRYALHAMSEDLRLAGYYGAKSFGCEEIYGNKACAFDAATANDSLVKRAGGTLPAVLPSPCEPNVANWVTPAGGFETYTNNHLLWAIQGYNNVTSVSGCTDLAAANIKSGTDVLVVRRQSTEQIAVASATANQAYIQTGSLPNDAARRIKFRLVTGPAPSTFVLQMKQQGGTGYVTTGINRMFLHVYFIAPCSRPAGAVCAASDDGIPTLKRLELAAGALRTVTIAEGIEDMNIEYGVDSDRDGSPDVFKDDPTVTEWWNVTAVRINLLARNSQTTPGYLESKQFDLGAGRTPVSFTGAAAGYKRHVYSELVRINNVGMRRE